MLNHHGVESDPLTKLSRDARVWATEIASGADQVIRGAPQLTAELIATEVARSAEILAARAWKIRDTISIGSVK